MPSTDLYSILSTPHAHISGLYRRLGRLEMGFADPHIGPLAQSLVLLLETQSILRLEYPDLELMQLFPAGKWFQGHRPEAQSLAQKVMHIIGERYFPVSAEGSLQVYKELKGMDDASFRNDPMWIGGDSVLTARYVAPEPDQIVPALDSLRLEPREDDIEVLGRLHSYGFLLLPFLKDNARWITLWTHVLARHTGLPSSGFIPYGFGILRHRQEYGRDLLAGAEGNMEAWDKTWLTCFETALTAAEQVLTGARNLLQENLEHEEIFGKSKIRLTTVLRHLCRCPYVTLMDICAMTGLTKPNAATLLKRCVDIGLLKQVTFEHRNRVYEAPMIVHLLAQS